MWIKREEWEELKRRVAELERRGPPHIFFRKDDGKWVVFGWDRDLGQAVSITDLLANIANHLGVETEYLTAQRVFTFPKKK